MFERYMHKEKEMYMHKEKEMYMHKEKDMYMHKYVGPGPDPGRIRGVR